MVKPKPAPIKSNRHFFKLLGVDWRRYRLLVAISDRRYFPGNGRSIFQGDKAVHFSRQEGWEIGEDLKVNYSLGWYDATEFQR